MSLKRELEEGKLNGTIPQYFTEEGLQTVKKGYLQEGETVKDMFHRVVNSMQKYGKFSDDIKQDILEVSFEKGWLGFATPVLSNSGTDSALPISCFIESLDDTMEDIMGRGVGELAMLSKMGGGVGVSFQSIRGSGTPIRNGKGGVSDGIIPFAKVYDSAILASKQPNVRRGNLSLNLSIEHPDAVDFINMRRVEGDINRQCLNVHHCITIPDSFMDKLENGDKEAQLKFFHLMKARKEVGEPYILYEGNVNRLLPEAYVKNNVTNNISYTNICSEIIKYADAKHTVVCCLSSQNLAEWNNWKDWKSPRTGLSLPAISIYALDSVMEEFIQRGSNVPMLENAVRAAKKDRGLGLGVMGWHTLLQKNGIAFGSFEAMLLNGEIFKFIQEESKKASKDLAKIHGEPEWCKGTGMRNSHLTAVAPTKSNSIICGDVSAGIEPTTANAYLEVSPKGTFVRKNKILKEVLKSYNMDNEEVWNSIEKNLGSIKHLNLPEEVKEVFLTAYEINQMDIIRQVAQRTPFICQSQSVNLFFSDSTDAETFAKVHIEAWKLGVKTLYYCKSVAGRVDTSTECVSCHG